MLINANFPNKIPQPTDTLTGADAGGLAKSFSMADVLTAAGAGGNFLPLAGGTMSGQIDMGGQIIHNCGGFFEGPGGGVPPGVGTVTMVSASPPLAVTNGSTNPHITIALATTTTPGVVLAGGGGNMGNVTINTDGSLSAPAGTSYTLPPATTGALGGVIVGTGLAVNGSGLLTVTGGATPGPHALSDHTDVSTAGAATGDLLQYNGTSWVPITMATLAGAVATNLDARYLRKDVSDTSAGNITATAFFEP